jgi:uncharacterized protein YjiS (DUF1127 family)
MADISATVSVVRRWLAAPVRSILRGATSHFTREVLCRLDDATLKDIGLRRGDIHQAVVEMKQTRLI